MKSSIKWTEQIITPLVKISGYSAIVFVLLIFYFLLREGLPTIGQVDFSNLISARWYPIENYFGLLPLIGGSLIVTLGAALIAIPIGICTAVYIAEVSPRGTRPVETDCRGTGRHPIGSAWFLGDPYFSTVSAPLVGLTNRAHSLCRQHPVERSSHSDDRICSRRCTRFSAKVLSGCSAGIGCNSMADNLASHPSSGTQRGINWSNVGNRSGNWGDDGGDDGYRECPRTSNKVEFIIYAGKDDDRHHCS